MRCVTVAINGPDKAVETPRIGLYHCPSREGGSSRWLTPIPSGTRSLNRTGRITATVFTDRAPRLNCTSVWMSSGGELPLRQGSGHTGSPEGLPMDLDRRLGRVRGLVDTRLSQRTVSTATQGVDP